MANFGGTDPADRVAVDLVPGAQKSGASAVRIDAVIRIENLHGFAASVPLLAILAPRSRGNRSPRAGVPDSIHSQAGRFPSSPHH